jgi:hypothetical protein
VALFWTKQDGVSIRGWEDDTALARHAAASQMFKTWLKFFFEWLKMVKIDKDRFDTQKCVAS